MVKAAWAAMLVTVALSAVVTEAAWAAMAANGGRGGKGGAGSAGERGGKVNVTAVSNVVLGDEFFVSGGAGGIPNNDVPRSGGKGSDGIASTTPGTDGGDGNPGGIGQHYGAGGKGGIPETVFKEIIRQIRFLMIPDREAPEAWRTILVTMAMAVKVVLAAKKAVMIFLIRFAVENQKETVTNTDQLVALFLGKSADKTVSHSYLEGAPVARIMALNAGLDLASGRLAEELRCRNGWFGFGLGFGFTGDQKTTAGRLDLDIFDLAVGVGRGKIYDNFCVTGAIFAEYGRGSFSNDYDKFSYGDGHADYIGGGLAGRVDFCSGLYFSASFGAGGIWREKRHWRSSFG